MATALIEVIEEFEIADKLLGVPADNASNNTTMMQELEGYFNKQHPQAGFSIFWNQIECMSHVINLGAKEIIKQFDNKIDLETYDGSDSRDRMSSALCRLSIVVRKIRDSPKLRRLLKTCCGEKGMKYSVPIIDVDTRWNSCYDMLKRAIAYKDLMADAVYCYKDKSLISTLLDDDWVSLERLISILEPLKEITLMTSKNSSSFAISNVFPFYSYCIEMLKEAMVQCKPDEDVHIGIEAAVQKLIHYYDNMSPIIGIALLLNPCYKKEFLTESLGWEKDWVDNTVESFYSSFEFYKDKRFRNENDASVEQHKDGGAEKKLSGFNKFLKRKRSNTNTVYANAEEEYFRYFNAPCADPESSPNILDYWKANESYFPVLSAMARDYLSVQASSVPAERAFSSGTDLVTPNRCSLTGTTIEMVQFLKFNLE